MNSSTTAEGRHFLDVVDRFAQTASSLKYQAQHNTTAPGPFTSALLFTNSWSEILREADETERGLFTLGVSDGSSAGFGGASGGGTKEIVRKEVVSATPLRRLRDAPMGIDTVGEPDEYLRAALRLVDEYKSMPRAREHILLLLEKSREMKKGIEELHQLLLQKAQGSGTVESDAGAPEQPAASFKDEEVRVREMESRVAAARKKRDALRRQLQTKSSTPSSSKKVPTRPSPSETSTTTATPPSPVIIKPRVKTSTSRALQERRKEREAKAQGQWNPFAQPSKVKVTAKGKQPDDMFWNDAKKGQAETETETGTEMDTSADTSALGDTPSPLLRRSRSKSELLMGTPLTSMKMLKGDSPGDVGAEDGVGGGGEEEDGSEADRTIMRASTGAPVTPPPAETYYRPRTPDPPPHEPELPTTDDKPVAEVGSQHDLELNSELEDIISKIWETCGDVILPSHDYDVGHGKGQYKPPRAEETFTLLRTVTESSDPCAALAHHPMTQPLPPPTPLQIVISHLLLSLLTSPPSYTLPMNKVKEILAGVVKEKGWDSAGGDGGLGVRAVYQCVGKKLLRINRKGGGGGVVEFEKSS